MSRREALLVAAGVFPARADWAQWRGGVASGVSKLDTLPEEWSATTNIAWKTAIPGRGHSSPVITGNRIFLTTSFEGEVVPRGKAPEHKLNGEVFVHPDATAGDKSHTLKTLCVDADSGKILWERTAYEGPVYDSRHRKNTFASPTAATDDKRVIVWFESQGLYCYDLDGKLLWKSSLGNVNTLGLAAGASPVLFEDLVYLQCDQDSGENSFLAAVSVRDGELKWKVKREVSVTWSTPHIAREMGKAELITTASEAVVAYDARSGKELWRGPGLEGYAVNTSVSGHGMVFVTTGYPVKRAYGMRLSGEGDRVVWKYEKGTGYVPSPILYGDYLYLMTDKGLLTCLDAKTGAVQYEGGRPPAPATFTASPVAFRGKLFQTNEDGDTFVIRAGPKHEVLATNSIGEPVYASMALEGDSIYLRGQKNLYRIRK